MPLVFAAVTPHPPLSIPNIGKDKTELLQKTIRAFERLREELYTSHPTSIIIISPHAGLFKEAFSVNGHDLFESSFEEFGDFETKKEWKGSPGLAASVSNKALLEHIPLQIISSEKLDHGSSIPLYHLTEPLPQISVLPIGYSTLTTEKHLRLGILLKDICLNSPKRIAVIASGDLSHTLSDASPGGYQAAGETFDSSLQVLLKQSNSDGIIHMDQQIVSEAQECVYRSLLILLGIIKNMHYRFETLCYEAPLGVGYLSGVFHLSAH